MSGNINRKAAIQKLKTLVLTPKADLEQFRSKLEEKYSTVFLPNHVECQERNYSGVKCDYLVPEVYSSHRIIIYIHGGSFVGGSRDSWRNFCSSFANAASSRILVPEFRLPPTHPFPASIEDIQTVLRMVYAEEEVALQLSQSDYDAPASESTEDERKKPEIIIAADGSGASLAMGVIFGLGERYKSCIKNLVLLSPWLNLCSDCELIAGKKVKDEVLCGADLHRAVDLYTYSSNIPNPLVSPLKADAEKFIGFPPVYIQMGEKEILLQQARQLAQKLEDAGVECIMDVWPEMMYMFQMADEFIPDSHLAVEKLGKFISKREGLSETEIKERDQILKVNDIK